MQNKIIKFKPRETGKKTVPTPLAAVKTTSIRKRIHHV